MLAKVKQIGYEEVETYWNLYSHPAAELRKMIGDAGLRVPSGHFDYEKVERSFDYAHALGLQVHGVSDAAEKDAELFAG